MEEQDKDPFAEFGGSVVTAKEDPFKEFGGVVVPKKLTPSGGPNTLKQLGNGFDISQPFQAPTELTPVLPQNRPAVKSQQQADVKQHDAELKARLNSREFADELSGAKKSREQFVQELATNPNAEYYVEKRAEAERNRYKGPITMSDRIHSVTGDIYGGLGTMGKGLVRSAGTLAKLITPDAIGSDERYDYDVNKINEVIDKAVNFGQRDGEISPEKKAAINQNPINGLISGLAEFAPAIATSARTGGMSFFFNDYEHGYENIDKADKENKLGLTEAQKQLYATAQGTASALLMSHNLHSLLGNASEKTTKGLIDKISLDAMENMAKSGEDFTGANLKKAVDVQLQTLEDKVKNFGVKAVVGTSKSIGDMAALEGAKIATDKLANTATGKKVFDMDNQAERMQEAIKTGALFGAAGAIMKAPAMLAKGSLERNSVIESIYKDPSPENIERIKTTVADRFRENPEDGQPTAALIDQIQGVAKALPKGLPLDKQIRATDLIMERKGLELAKEQNAESNKGLDPVFGDQHAVQDTAYQDRIDSINDQIKSLASDKPVKYFKDEAGQPMKQFGDEEPEKINENRYYTEKPHLAEERKVKVEEPVVEETITETPTEPVIDEPATPSPETPADVQGQPEQPVSPKENSSAPVEANSEKVTFKTAKGSTYDVNEDGTTIRNKKERSDYGHEGQKGIQPASTKTVYVTKEDLGKLDLVQAIHPDSENGGKFGIAYENDKIGVAAYDKDGKGGIVKRTIVTPETEPRVGLYPVEIWDGNPQPHFGNEIVEVNAPAKVKPDIRQKAIDAITHGIIGNGERKAKDVSPRFDLDMDTAEQKRAIRDITNGKYETAAAKKMIDKVSEFEANGDYPIIEGDGGSTVRQRGATPEEIQRNIDDIKQYKLAKEQDIELNNQQLKGQDLTHDDFENYYRHRAEELGRTGEPSDSGTVGSTPKDAQRAKNDKATSDTPNTSSEATQGKPERQPSLNEHELNRKLELRKKFAGRFNDVTNIPTLLADKEFREYAGLVLKEATGDFKAFSKELIDNIGEKIKPHLDKLFAELSEEKTRPSKNEETGERAYEMGVELKKSKERSRGEDVVEKDASDKIKNGYDVYELIDKIVKDKHAATDTEVAILNKYIDVKEGEIKTYNERLGAEGATMGKKDFMDLMDAKTKSEMEFQDAAEANRLTGRITAQALNARKFRFNKENSLENMVAKKRQALGGEKLTAEQLSEITARFSEMENIQKQLEARVKKVESDNYKLKAEQTVKKVATNRGNRPVAKAELANERAKIYDDIRSEFKKIRQSGQAMSDIPYRRELAVVAKHMPRLLRNLAQDGLIRIEDVVESLYNTFKEDLPEITKRDVTDLIAGKYDEVKPSKSELQDNIRSLRIQAKLAGQIADLEAGIKTEKSPKAIKEKNEQIEALKARLKELNKDESVDTSKKDLAALKKRLQSNIDKLSKRIADGDYSKEEKKAPVKPDAEARDLQRQYDAIKHDFELEIARDYLKQRTKTQKLIDDALNVTGVPRALKSSFDLSAAGRQGLFLLPHVKESTTALKQMFGQMTSEERYNNWISDLKHDPMYDLMKESGLYIADKNDPKLSAREEEFTSNLAEKIPFGIGAGVKASERAYTGYLNVIRTEVFKSEATKLMERGYTYENSPKEFTSLARVVNILSGRGEIPKSWGHSAPKVLSLGLFSPRFLAARIQTLYLWADPSLSKNAKILAAKDVGSVLGSAISLLGMASMAGYSVNWNPTSTNFLKLEDKDENGSTYYDILGGLPQYVRFLSQIFTGKKTSASGNETDTWADRGPTNPFGTTPGDVITSFTRGKISPVPGMLINLAFREDVVGQPYGLKNVPYDFLAPLPLASLQEAYKVGGIDNALKVLIPSTIGIGVSSYNPNEKKEDTSIKKLKLPGGSEFELNEEQVADRQKMNAKFIDEKGDKLTKAFTRKAETDKDLLKKIKKQSAEQSPEDAKATKQNLIDEYVERHIKSLANKNSMPYIYKKYKKDLKPIDE